MYYNYFNNLLIKLYNQTILRLPILSDQLSDSAASIRRATPRQIRRFKRSKSSGPDHILLTMIRKRALKERNSPFKLPL